MGDVERVVINDTKEEGYFSDIVAREEMVEVKRIVEEVKNIKELTEQDVSDIYNTVYKKIFG